jgi:hypothetical protein
MRLILAGLTAVAAASLLPASGGDFANGELPRTTDDPLDPSPYRNSSFMAGAAHLRFLARNRSASKSGPCGLDPRPQVV